MPKHTARKRALNKAKADKAKKAAARKARKTTTKRKAVKVAVGRGKQRTRPKKKT